MAKAGGDDDLTEKILTESDWRFGYIAHCVKVGEIVASNTNGVAAAKAGIDKLYSTFVIRDPKTNDTVTIDKVNDVAPLADPVFKAKVVKG